MKYYIDKETSEVYAYEEDGSQDHLILENLKPMSAKASKAHFKKYGVVVALDEPQAQSDGEPTDG